MRTKWFSARAMKLHLTLVVVAGGCLALGWWQLSRALAGNSLSWVYTFEWPFFAAYAVYTWQRLVREGAAEAAAADASTAGASAAETSAGRQPPVEHEPASPIVAERIDEPGFALGFDPYDESDPELAAYNRYLASLHASDRAKSRRA